jgi:hypothetical protein
MASYAESLLTKDERVVYKQKQHWLSLILDSRLAILFWGITIIAAIVRLLFFRDGGFGEVTSLVVLFSLVAGIVIVAYRWWVWTTQEYLVTNRRLLNVSGIVNKRSADSSLEKINDAILEVNLVGRLLGYGDLKILTAAASGIDRYKMLNQATEFKKMMLTAKHELQTSERGDGDDYRASSPSGSSGAAGAMSAPTAASTASLEAPVDVSGGADPLRADTPDEVAAVLAQLTRLRDQGALSSGEFEIKKKELLDRL